MNLVHADLLRGELVGRPVERRRVTADEARLALRVPAAARADRRAARAERRARSAAVRAYRLRALAAAVR